MGPLTDLWHFDSVKLSCQETWHHRELRGEVQHWTATLWQVRQGLMDAYAPTSPAVTTVIDLTVMSYHNALRVQGWTGDLALGIEQELFGEDSLKLKLRQRYGREVVGFAIEEALQRLKEQLLPLFERVNRQLLQSLRALQELLRGVSPTVAIARRGRSTSRSTRWRSRGEMATHPSL